MLSTAAISLGVVLSVAVLLWLSAWSDLASRTIPNWLPSSIIVLYFLFAVISPMPLDVGASLAAAGAVFAIAAVGFALGKVGGGDVKLMTAVALWAGPGWLPLFLFVMALTGGVLAIVAFNPYAEMCWSWAVDRVARNSQKAAAPANTSGIPYAVAIALGGSMMLLDRFQNLV